jgi:hypothetical protein
MQMSSNAAILYIKIQITASVINRFFYNVSPSNSAQNWNVFLPTKLKHLVQFVAASLPPHKNLVTGNGRTKIATSNGFTLVQSLYDHHPQKKFIYFLFIFSAWIGKHEPTQVHDHGTFCAQSALV